MQYSVGKPGRVFFIRFEHGEDLVAGLTAFCRRETVICGTVQVIGALLDGTMACGPEKPVLPPDPVFRNFSGGWEIIGTGVILPGENGPRIHLHASGGHGAGVMTGCLRVTPSVYLTVEAVITEVTGIEVALRPDPASGQVLPAYPRSMDC